MKARNATALALAATLGACLLVPQDLHAADWPMAGHDAHRSYATPSALPTKLVLSWSREFPALTPAWPDQSMMQFDAAYDPIVLGNTLFLSSPRHDFVLAIDTATGKDRWRFFADGPIRFAPVAWKDRLFAVSDDGYLYCLDAERGKLLWKFRGGPGDRKIIGNDRVVSTWPARGAPVVVDDTVYFAASIWPFMGIFIHALDARTGNVVWTNDGDGSMYIRQPHNTDSFAGVAPQGYLAALQDRLFIPGGRSIPAIYDRKTGKFLAYQLAQNGKRGGGSSVSVCDKFFLNGGAAFHLESQKYLGTLSEGPVAISSKTLFTYTGSRLHALDLNGAKIGSRAELKELAEQSSDGMHCLIAAGKRIYLGGAKRIEGIDFDGAAFTPAWQAKTPGNVVRLIAADERLFAVTLEGHLLCFSKDSPRKLDPPEPAKAEPAKTVAAKTNAETQTRVREILKSTKVGAGYAVVLGNGNIDLPLELVRQSELHVVALDADAKRVRKLREIKVAEDLTRLTVLPGDIRKVSLPPYMASLVIADDWASLKADADLLVDRVLPLVRPHGGEVLCSPAMAAQLEKALAGNKSGVSLKRQGNWLAMCREGALPGAANWTHEHADAANTRVSRDQLVKAPLGVLWFGGPSHEGILPRHGHGPQPQVVDGRQIIEGVDMLRALDIYTGRLLWETPFPGIGKFYDNTAHQPGANATSANFISTPEGIYVAYENACVVLDPATGKKTQSFHLPDFAGNKQPPVWGYINVAGDYLVGGADPLADPALFAKKGKKTLLSKFLSSLRSQNDNLSSSRHLVVMDRATGKVLWSAEAKSGFRHNAVCAGGDKLFAIDRVSGVQLKKLRSQGKTPDPARLVVYDIKTGKKLWSSADDIFGTWLSYSAEHDVLVEAGRVARDTILDEPRGMRAYQAGTGKVLWHDKTYLGPAMIKGDTIFQGQGACNLLTGVLKTRKDPITGKDVPWEWRRNYGCNTPAASQHLLLFRSGAAGYFDLLNDSGTGNFGGFRSSCTNNLIVAGGVLTAPDYTRTCTCLYQNQSSIGLIHMPEAEMWTFFGSRDASGPLRRLGINFGAPGDRKSTDGTLWLEYPSVAGYSPTLPITLDKAPAGYFRRHSALVEGPLGWVAASGATGLSTINIKMGDNHPAKQCTVRLIFCEPKSLPKGKRRFHVFIGDRKVLDNFDIAGESAAANRPASELYSIVKTFRVPTAPTQTIRLEPAANSEIRESILSGIEVIAE